MVLVYCIVIVLGYIVYAINNILKRGLKQYDFIIFLTNPLISTTLLWLIMYFWKKLKTLIF